jgi:hypothetical protein
MHELLGRRRAVALGTSTIELVKTVSSTIGSPTIPAAPYRELCCRQHRRDHRARRLIKDHSDNMENGISILSNIPILGDLFIACQREE